MLHRLRGDVELEFANMAEVLEQTLPNRTALVELSLDQPPDAWDRRAAAGVLHEWYGGVENTLKRICKIVDRSLPSGESSHKDLLRQATQPFGQRPPVCSPEMYIRLNDYREFRHVARHKYSIELDWGRQRPLLEMLPADHARFVAEVRHFLDAIGAP